VRLSPGVRAWSSNSGADSENWLDLIRRLSVRWAEVGLASRMLGVPGTVPPSTEDLLEDRLSAELLASAAMALGELHDEQALVRAEW
jgi:hypothetical protein